MKGGCICACFFVRGSRRARSVPSHLSPVAPLSCLSRRPCNNNAPVLHMQLNMSDHAQATNNLRTHSYPCRHIELLPSPCRSTPAAAAAAAAAAAPPRGRREQVDRQPGRAPLAHGTAAQSMQRKERDVRPRPPRRSGAVALHAAHTHQCVCHPLPEPSTHHPQCPRRRCAAAAAFTA